MPPPSLLSGFLTLIGILVLIVLPDLLPEIIQHYRAKKNIEAIEQDISNKPIIHPPSQIIRSAADRQSKKYIEPLPEPPFTAEYGRKVLQASRQMRKEQADKAFVKATLLHATPQGNSMVSSSDNSIIPAIKPLSTAKVVAQVRDTVRLPGNYTTHDVVNKFNKQERIEIVKRIRTGDSNYKILKEMFNLTKGAKYSQYGKLINVMRTVVK